MLPPVGSCWEVRTGAAPIALSQTSPGDLRRYAFRARPPCLRLVGGRDFKSPRMPRRVCAPPDFALHTDSSTSTTRIDALLFRERSLPPSALRRTYFRSPGFSIRRFNRRNLISCLGILVSHISHMGKLQNFRTPRR